MCQGDVNRLGLFKLRAYVCLVLSQKKIKFATENDVKSYASY